MQDLVSSPRKWKNLESFDVRTPTTYFQNKKVSNENASRVIEALVHGTSDEAMEAIRKALDYKVFRRVKPFMEKTGEDMEEQIFWIEQYGN